MITTEFYERCSDCGGDVKERKQSKRDTICDECWERRVWLVSRLSVYENDPRFHKIQRAMAYRTGTAKRQILALQKEEQDADLRRNIITLAGTNASSTYEALSYRRGSEPERKDS